MKNKLKLVVDTQIFINSLFKDTYFYCDFVMDLIEEDRVDLLFSQESIGELMQLTKNFAKHVIEEDDLKYAFMYNVAGLFFDSTSVNISKTICPRINDEDDNMLLKCAMAGYADYIVTDDLRHGMHGNEILKDIGIKVVTSKDFLSIFEGKYNY